MPDATPYQKADELLKQGRGAEVVADLLRHLRRNPTDMRSMHLLAEAYLAQGDYAKAEYYRLKTIAAFPNEPRFVTRLAAIHFQQKNLNRAIEIMQGAWAKSPGDPVIGPAYCAMLTDQSRLEESLQVCDQTQVTPENRLDLLEIRAGLLHRMGRTEESLEVLRESLRTTESGVSANSAVLLATTILYSSRATPREVLAAHSLFGRLLGESATHAPVKHAPSDDPERRLRIALVSSDFRDHSVAYFAEAILRHLDRARFETWCYHTAPVLDAVTEKLRRLAGRFIVAPSAQPAQLASRIAGDRIDILVELGGLFRGNSLDALVYKPAPVQVTYIGYPATTGVRAIDYRIVDSHTDPAGDPYEAQEFATEKLVRLDPCFLCYTPRAEALAVPPRAHEQTAGTFTFGSFNALPKTNVELLALWAKILEGTPGSRLVLKATGLAHASTRAGMIERLSRAGIPIERVELLRDTPDPADHLRMYHQVDLALDTFPYHGTTTTCEALMMGVPALTLAGPSHTSRVGVSLLRNMQMEDLVATTPDRYVQRAIELGNNPTMLAPHRGPQLRRRMLESPICDGAAYGQRLGEALRTMWRVRCTPRVPIN